MLPICSHEERNGEGRRRGKLTKFISRGRGRREEEDGMLGLLGCFQSTLARREMKKEEEEEAPAVAMKKRNEG